MGEQQFIPVLQRGQPECGGEIDADLPFGGIHARLQSPGGAGCGAHGVSPSMAPFCGASVDSKYVRATVRCPLPPSLAGAWWSAAYLIIIGRLPRGVEAIFSRCSGCAKITP